LAGSSFYGQQLQIKYVPEYESLEEIREKMNQRRQIIAKKTSQPNVPKRINPTRLM